MKLLLSRIPSKQMIWAVELMGGFPLMVADLFIYFFRFFSPPCACFSYLCSSDFISLSVTTLWHKLVMQLRSFGFVLQICNCMRKERKTEWGVLQSTLKCLTLSMDSGVWMLGGESEGHSRGGGESLSLSLSLCLSHSAFLTCCLRNLTEIHGQLKLGIGLMVRLLCRHKCRWFSSSYCSMEKRCKTQCVSMQLV